MNCPESERLSAYAEGRLEASDAALFLEHCADCDDCRRELALLTLARGKSDLPAPVPVDVKARALHAIHRTLERDRDRTPRHAHSRVFVRGGERRPVAALVAAAAAVLIAVAGLVALVRMRDDRAGARGDDVQIAAPNPKPVPAPALEVVPAPERTSVPTPPPDLPPRRPPVQPALPPTEQPRVEDPRPDPALPEPEPRPEESRPRETAPAKPSHTIVARALGELQITDVTGTLNVRRKGSREKEKLSGVARIGEGDVLTTEKPSGFRVQGTHPVVLSENSTLSLAYAPQDQAPYMYVRAGEATVDSTSPTPWVVSDGRVAVVIKQARGRFAAAASGDRLLVSALSEPLLVEPDGGHWINLRPGEECAVGKAEADVRRLDLNVVTRKGASFDAARSRQRTIFFTSCDATDANRGHYFVQEGTAFRNEALLSQTRPDKTAHAVISPNPRFHWREGLLFRFRYRTNATQIQVSLRVDERKYTLFKAITVERKNANQWLSAEILVAPSGLSFRRDDGVQNLTITSEDKFDWIDFQAHPKDVFGDQKVYVLVDDIQVVEKEKE